MEAKLNLLRQSAADLRAALGAGEDTPLSALPAVIAGMAGGGGKTQTKTVSPLKAGQTITPDGGYAGLDKVTLTGLSNLTPENIPFGITIGAVTGTAKVAVRDTAPDDLPVTEEDADAIYTSITGGPHTGDKFLLADDLGNITCGYLDDPTGFVVCYNGWELPYFDHGEMDGAASWIERPYALMFQYDTAQIALLFTEAPLFVNDSGAVRMPVSYFRCYFFTPGKDAYWWLKRSAPNDSEAPFNYKILWTNHDICRNDGTVYMKAQEPTHYYTGGFTLTRYDPLTTEFAAVGWRRLSYHVETEEWNFDDFTTTPSTGWNYLGNIRWCSRKELLHRYLPVWPKAGTKVDCVSADMTQWTKNAPAANAFTAITYDAAADVNTCQYTGAGMFEYIGFPIKLTAGKTYAFSLDYCCPAGVTGQYDVPFAPYFGFFPATVLTSDATAYLTGHSSRLLPLAAADYGTYVCTYTPSVTVTVAVAVGFGSTLDGVATEFQFRNMALWELPEADT